MANLIRTLPLSNAAAYECARSGHDIVDVDHVLLALLATGGPVARIMAEHGLTLASTRETVSVRRRAGAPEDADDPTTQSIPVGALRDDVSGGLPWTARATELWPSPAARTTDLELLLTLMDEEGGVVWSIIEMGDAEAGAVQAEVESTLDDGDDGGTEIGEHTFSDDDPAVTVSLDHALAQPVDIVWPSLVDSGLVCLWAGSPETSRVVSGGVETTFERLGHRGHIRLDPTLVEEPGPLGARVVWQERQFSDKVRGDHGGWYDLQLTPTGPASTLRLTRGLRTFGALGRALMPIARRSTAANLNPMAQDIAYASARRY
ncbi:Clp protease N-terminal domain-containing protein [Agilicoccus flavus]|uniref:Clp protease N-terminal domain-containing protein n=1 Tax=Agilicoccus flavus TaxID=2775968 RepID=UPI001CF71606|nr:Clp protease N-terminal domain-containing protein [Agilicoccus flavus]